MRFLVAITVSRASSTRIKRSLGAMAETVTPEHGRDISHDLYDDDLEYLRMKHQVKRSVDEETDFLSLTTSDLGDLWFKPSVQLDFDAVARLVHDRWCQSVIDGVQNWLSKLDGSIPDEEYRFKSKNEFLSIPGSIARNANIINSMLSDQSLIGYRKIELIPGDSDASAGLLDCLDDFLYFTNILKSQRDKLTREYYLFIAGGAVRVTRSISNGLYKQVYLFRESKRSPFTRMTGPARAMFRRFEQFLVKVCELTDKFTTWNLIDDIWQETALELLKDLRSNMSELRHTRYYAIELHIADFFRQSDAVSDESEQLSKERLGALLKQLLSIILAGIA
jgi:hypothetical protein